MSMIDKMRDKVQKEGAEAAKREQELVQLRNEMINIELLRAQAIDQDDFRKVEDLTSKRHDLMLKIEAKEAIQKRKADVGVPRAEIRAAWAEDCKGYQKQVDKAEKELGQLMRQVAEKVLAIADAINASWEARTAALVLVDDDEPAFLTSGNNDFDLVTFTGANLELPMYFFDNDEMLKIRADSLQAIARAEMDRCDKFWKAR